MQHVTVKFRLCGPCFVVIVVCLTCIYIYSYTVIYCSFGKRLMEKEEEEKKENKSVYTNGLFYCVRFVTLS